MKKQTLPPAPNPYRSPVPCGGTAAPQSDAWATDRQTASRHARLAAAAIDAILPTVLLVVWLESVRANLRLTIETNFAVRPATALALVPAGRIVAILWIYELLQAGLITVLGQTIGKMILKIRIAQMSDDAKAGFLRGVVVRRWLIGLLGLIPFFSLFDVLRIFKEDSRCIHDRLAGTRVIFADSGGQEFL